MILAGIQESQGFILAFVAFVILIIVIASVIKFGIKTLIVWIIIGIIAYLYISSAILQ